MRLRQWAEQNGVSYRTAWRWATAGTMPVPAHRTASGTWLVSDVKVPVGSDTETKPCDATQFRERYATALRKALTAYARTDIDPGTGSDVGDQVAIALSVYDNLMAEERIQ